MNKLLKSLNSKKVQKFITKIPYIFILMLLILLPPIGVWFLVVKVNNKKKKIYHNKRFLMWLGIIIFFMMGLGIYYKIKEIINLYDSGMSLDMINFIPDDVHLYAIGVVMCISYFIGVRKLNQCAKIQQVYTKMINLEHVDSLSEISDKLNISLNDVKINIHKLIDGNFLLPVTITKDNKIVYEEEKNIQKDEYIQCSKCGAFIHNKKDEYVECDFCGHGLIKDNN